MEMELLTFGFGHTLMDLYQILHFELFPGIIYIYIVENISDFIFRMSIFIVC